MPPKTRMYNRTAFQRIDDEESAYWLGFLCADGNVRFRTENSIQIRLGLVVKDGHHVRQFRDYICRSLPVRECMMGKTEVVELAFCDYQIGQNLIAYGCVPNKTRILKYPEFLVGSPLERHFLRGFWDGDGTYSGFWRKNRWFRPSLSLTCASPRFAERMRERLLYGANLEGIVLICKSHSENRMTSIGSYRDADRLYHWFYNDATVFLPRKKAALENVLVHSCHTMQSSVYRASHNVA